MPRLIFLVTEDWYFISHRLPLALAAKERGFDVTVITRCGGKCEEIRAAGLDVVRFEMARRGLNPLRLLSEAVGVAKIYRQIEPDLVHHVALRPIVVGGLAAPMAGVKNVVAAIAGLGYAFADEGRIGVASVLRVLLRSVLRRGEVIVQNPDDAGAVAHLGVPKERVHLVLGAGVDITRFVPTPEPDGTPTVMLPSRLLWDKGIGEFIQAAQQLQRRGIKAHFVLVGAPDPANPTSVPESDIKEWIKNGVIEWWGYKQDMETVLPQAHIVCLPSYYREGIPKVLIEALACGRAVITCDVPGCREVVVHEENGLLVPARDPDSLADAIERLLRDADQRRRFGNEGRQRAERLFGLKQVIDQTMKVYRGLLPQDAVT